MLHVLRFYSFPSLISSDLFSFFSFSLQLHLSLSFLVELAYESMPHLLFLLLRLNLANSFSFSLQKVRKKVHVICLFNNGPFSSSLYLNCIFLPVLLLINIALNSLTHSYSSSTQLWVLFCLLQYICSPLPSTDQSRKICWNTQPRKSFNRLRYLNSLCLRKR